MSINPPKVSVPVSPASFVIDRKSNGRAIYDPKGKQALVLHCLQPSVSVAGAALKAGVNANLLRKWILRYQRENGMRPPAVEYRRSRPDTGALIPVVLQESAPRAAAAVPTHLPTLTIEIDGARIGVAPGFDAATLREVVQILRTARA